MRYRLYRAQQKLELQHLLVRVRHQQLQVGVDKQI